MRVLLLCFLIAVVVVYMNVDAGRSRNKRKGRKSRVKSKGYIRYSSRKTPKNVRGKQLIEKDRFREFDISKELKITKNNFNVLQKESKRDVLRKLKNVKKISDFFKEFHVDKYFKLSKVSPNLRPVTQTRKDGIIGDVDKNEEYRISKLGSEEGLFQTNDQPMSFTEFDCLPREKIVQIPVKSDSAYYPSCVTVKQCSGCCHNSPIFECAPTLLRNRSTTVFKINYMTQIPSFTNIFMLHHEQCGCRCRVQKEDCNPYQTYDSANCLCSCNKATQACPFGKQWSRTACTCKCSQERLCANRFRWDEDSCSCRCKNKRCAANRILDPTTCYCV